jgi:membrane protein involved in colicin uptake
MAVDRQGWAQGLQRPPPSAGDSGKKHPEAARRREATRRLARARRARVGRRAGSRRRCHCGRFRTQAPGAGKDKALEEKKAQAEAAEAAKKKAEEEKLAKAKAENCTRARQAKASFETGRPITQSNAQGERVFLDEAGRAAEIKRIDGVIAADCKR